MLDPKDWSAFRALSHAALDDALDYLEGIRDRPVWREMPDDVQARLNEPLPIDPTPLDAVYRSFVESIFPYASGNTHPRFFGWVQGAGTPTGAVADLLASTMNPNVGGRNHGAVFVERAVLRWFCELFGLPDGASGVLTVGASSANLIAVLVARTRALGAQVREHGITREGGRLIGYASSATHSCVRRAFEVSGLGSGSLRVLPTDSLHRVDPTAVARAIADDHAAGNRPFMLIGNAGTVDVGAIDPLDELADLAQREGLWYHVDGALGAPAMLSSSLAPRLHGLERADSIAFDFHKWLQVPYDAGALLVRDGELHRETFASTPSYLTRMPRGLASAQPWFTDFTIDLSRGFRALKIWFTMKEHGASGIAAAIEANVRQARLLGDLIDADRDFELLAPVQLNIVCFRYRRADLDEDELDRFNDELVIALQESGEAVASSTTVGTHRAIRICIINHRTTDADLVYTLGAIKRLAHHTGTSKNPAV
ncbi:MAG TPA: pyridoxal-dependent decarboxylase [Candidatus Acidoferrum sp.]|nr:pyridoxal-dependent decarboxylase [Candidatus Acidoferrum sp.]